MKAFKAFIKPFEVPQRSVKIKILLNFFSSSNIETGRSNTIISLHQNFHLQEPQLSGSCGKRLSHNVFLSKILELQWPGSLCLKLASAVFYQPFIFSPNDSPSKTMKNVFFLFHLKSSFRSQDIQIFLFCPPLFQTFQTEKDKWKWNNL